jgi:hypothetical protein
MEHFALYKFLFVDIKVAYDVYKTLLKIAEQWIPVSIVIGGIYQLISGGNFKQFFTKIVLSVTLLYHFPAIHKTMKTTGFSIAKRVMDKGNKAESFLLYEFKYKLRDARRKYKKGNDDVSLLNRMLNVPRHATEDLILKGFHSMILVQFMVLKWVYTLVYYLTLVFVPLVAVFNLLPFADKSLAGAIKSLFWVLLFPIVTASFLAIISHIVSFPDGYHNDLGAHLSVYVQLFVTGLLLLGVPIVTISILNGEGVQSWATDVSRSQMMAATFALPMAMANYSRNKFRKAYDYDGNAMRGMVHKGKQLKENLFYRAPQQHNSLGEAINVDNRSKYMPDFSNVLGKKNQNHSDFSSQIGPLQGGNQYQRSENYQHSNTQTPNQGNPVSNNFNTLKNHNNNSTVNKPSTTRSGTNYVTGRQNSGASIPNYTKNPNVNHNKGNYARTQNNKPNPRSLISKSGVSEKQTPKQYTTNINNNTNYNKNFNNGQSKGIRPKPKIRPSPRK